MERVFKLKLPLACLHEKDDLPAGTLAMEPRRVIGTVIFLGSVDGGQSWKEYATIIDDELSDWFEPVASEPEAFRSIARPRSD